jgi:RNA polymerase sigma-70 factor (ECF subfamily)
MVNSWTGKFGRLTDGGVGSRAAGRVSLEQVYRRHWDEIRRYVRQRFGSGPPEPEDIAQAAFARYAALDSETEVANPRAFLFRTAHNLAVDARRSSGRGAAAVADPQLAGTETVDFSPEDVLVAKDELARLDAALARLKPKQRVALLMHRIDGLSYAEIGRRLGLSPSGARVLVERAFEACMTSFDKEGRR